MWQGNRLELVLIGGVGQLDVIRSILWQLREELQSTFEVLLSPVVLSRVLDVLGEHRAVVEEHLDRLLCDGWLVDVDPYGLVEDRELRHEGEPKQQQTS